MSNASPLSASTRAVALATSMLLPSIALAQSAPPAGAWQFAASVYAYLPTISAGIRDPISGGGADLALDADTILANLKMTFMGTFEAHNGRWGVATDVIYFDVGNSKSGFREFTIGNIGLPATASASVDLDLRSVVWTLAGEYRVATTPAYTLDLLGGARYLDVTSRLQWSITGDLGQIPAAGRTGDAKTGGQNWDAIVGARGRFNLGEAGKWSTPFYLDVGTGESELTWQGMAGVSYAFRWGEVLAAWRYLDYHFKEGALDDMSTNGPLIGATFRW